MLLNIEIYFESMKFFLLHRHSDVEDRSDFYLWRIRNFISRQQEVRQRKGLLAICSAGWQVKNKDEYPMSIVSFLCLHRYLCDLLSLLSGPFINQDTKLTGHSIDGLSSVCLGYLASCKEDETNRRSPYQHMVWRQFNVLPMEEYSNVSWSIW